jgi:hypothetical protein
MEEIKAFKGDKIKDSTLKVYGHKLKKLKSLFDTDSFDFLNRPEDIFDKLSRLNYQTQKNYINAIIVYLQAINGDQQIIETYSKKRDEYGNQYNKAQESGVISDSQKDNFVTSDDIAKMIGLMKKDIQSLSKESSEISADLNELYQAYILYNLYHRFPIRNDVALMVAIKASDYKKITDNSINYLVIGKSDMKIILNEYKTSKIYGQNKIDIEDLQLKKLLRKYVKDKGYGVLFTGRDGKPWTRNRISQILIKYSQKYLNKNVGSVMLAKAYLSSKYADKKDIYKEMAKDASVRGHSVGVQQAIYTKTN